MIVRNESSCLERCLNSTRGLVDEMIIVDTGSTDGTQDLARKAGARLLQSTWKADFSLARNESLEAATGSWILVLDADEELHPQAAEQIRSSLLEAKASQAQSCAFTLIQNSSNNGGKTGMKLNIIRLFPRLPSLRYEWPVHEQVGTSLQRLGLPVYACPAEILHHGYNDAIRNQEKQTRNIALLKKQIESGASVNALTWFLLGGAHLDLKQYPEALAAYSQAKQLAPAQSEIASGATIRLADCLYHQGRYEAVL